MVCNEFGIGWPYNCVIRSKMTDLLSFRLQRQWPWGHGARWDHWGESQCRWHICIFTCTNSLLWILKYVYCTICLLRVWDNLIQFCMFFLYPFRATGMRSLTVLMRWTCVRLFSGESMPMVLRSPLLSSREPLCLVSRVSKPFLPHPHFQVENLLATFGKIPCLYTSINLVLYL